MIKRTVGLCFALALAACGSSGGSTDAATIDGAKAIDAGPSDASMADKVARGKYIVDHVANCGDCHTPRTSTGAPDLTKYLAGNPNFLDVAPSDPATGNLPTKNLTNDPTGLMNFSDDQIKNMFLNGMDELGKPLAPLMPYWAFHNMSAADADAVVAYLRTVPGVSQTIPAKQEPWASMPLANYIDLTKVPAAPAGNDAAVRGRYLASTIALCIDCHTPNPSTPGPDPRDLNYAFAGGQDFPAALLGLPVPPFPADIYSSNLTQDATQGLAGWTAADIVNELHMGKNKGGQNICPPMPVGPMGGFGGLTDQDANDIAAYILSLPAVNNPTTNTFQACP